MKAEDIRLFKTIGKIQSVISASKNLGEAVRAGMKLILENSMADYAVIWYAGRGRGEKELLRPYYWICPSDLTSFSYAPGEGIPGRVFQHEKREVILDFENEADARTKAEFAGLGLSSVVCVPLSGGNENLGAVEFLKTAEHGTFSEDEADVCEMLVMLGQMAIEAYDPRPEEAPEKPVLLSAKNIEKSYRNGGEMLKVLKGVSFDVFQGEFLCFLGESGCGKSTMLNIIGGILGADAGSLKFGGRELLGLSKEELTEFRRENIGFIFQSYNLMSNLTVKENLDLIAELVENPADSGEILKLVGMEEKAGNYPSELSGGQQQRVSIARALVKKPRLILADEPTAALDYETSIGVLTVLEEVKRQGTTLVMVTHNEEITRMADRIIRFKGGRAYETTVNMAPVHATDLEW